MQRIASCNGGITAPSNFDISEIGCPGEYSVNIDSSFLVGNLILDMILGVLK